MKALVIYTGKNSDRRKTIEDSIFSFGKYHPKDVQVYYYNYILKKGLNSLIKKMDFDFIIFHSMFIWLRGSAKKKEWDMLLDDFKGIWSKAVKAVLVQDEQYMSNRTLQFIKKIKIDVIFTVGNKESAEILYPVQKIGEKRIEQVLTGYVDIETLKEVKRIAATEHITRNIDIGYRADDTPYSLGYQGRLKTLIPEIFNKKLLEFPQVKADIRNTFGMRHAFLGLDWFRFMLRCRTMIACMGGASVRDENGELRRKVTVYICNNRGCTYEEVKKNILDIEGKEIDYVVISPRCFEAAMTKTCQVLIEGDYAGIFKPGIHYIEVKKDFSNLDEVITALQDKELCQKIADRTYRDIIRSNKYTYEQYVRKVFDILKEEKKCKVSRNHINFFIGKLYLKFYNFLVDKEYLY